MKKLLVASALLHLAVFGALRSRPTPAPVAAEAPMKLEEVSIETETPLPVAVEESTTEPTTASTKVATRAIRSNGGGGGGGPTTATSAAASSEAIAGGNTDWVVNLGPGAEPRKFAGPTNPFLTQTPEPPPNPNAPRKDNSLRDALVAQDAAKGLGPDGPVLRALEEETRTSLAPDWGNATFRAIVDASGTVTALHLLDSSGDRGGWDDARARALAALQKKKIDLRGGKGAEFDIRVESELRYPSGAVATDGIGGGRLTLSADLSDIGTHPQRVVHARITRITPL